MREWEEVCGAAKKNSKKILKRKERKPDEEEEAEKKELPTHPTLKNKETSQNPEEPQLIQRYAKTHHCIALREPHIHPHPEK